MSNFGAIQWGVTFFVLGNGDKIWQQNDYGQFFWRELLTCEHVGRLQRKVGPEKNEKGGGSFFNLTSCRMKMIKFPELKQFRLGVGVIRTFNFICFRVRVLRTFKFVEERHKSSWEWRGGGGEGYPISGGLNLKGKWAGPGACCQGRVQQSTMKKVRLFKLVSRCRKMRLRGGRGYHETNCTLYFDDH